MEEFYQNVNSNRAFVIIRALIMTGKSGRDNAAFENKAIENRSYQVEKVYGRWEVDKLHVLHWAEVTLGPTQTQSNGIRQQ
jgi:hypothetical protein